MAEERIRIINFLWPDCKDCGGKCTDTKFCKECQPGMPKAKAIELMSKAICAKKHCSYVCNGCEVWMNFKDCAEVALNALLSEGE